MPAPNLLFLYTDEQRYDTLAAYGNTRIQMPNLDRLAEQSTVFERAYCTQPVCTPSRCSLLTGLWPHTSGCTRNNIPLRPETKCLPEMLPTGRYLCAHHGKWHLGDEIFRQHGFDEWRSTEDVYHAYYRPDRDQSKRSDFHHWLVARGHTPDPNDLPPEIGSRFFRKQIARLPEQHSRPAFLSEQAARFIRDNSDRPWALYVNFLEPHMPFHSCRDGQYSPDDVELPANFDPERPALNVLRHRLKAARYFHNGFEGQPLKTERHWRELIARYWGLCSLVDTHVGRILDALRETGRFDNTIIVFTSDHGDMMGSHGLLGKTVMFEQSVRVPMLIRLPGQAEPRRVTGPVSQIDVVPTLLDLLGAGRREGLQGTSLRPQLAGGGRVDRDVFIEWIPDGEGPGQITGAGQGELPDYAAGIAPPEGLAASCADSIRTIVTTDGWKLNCSAAGEHELFDLGADPLERHNLAGDPAVRRRMAELAERIRAWQRRTDDTLDLPAIHP